MSKRAKRRDYRRPDGQAPAGAPRPPDPPAREPRRQLAAWWPLVAAAGFTLLLVLIVVLANADSPPQPTIP